MILPPIELYSNQLLTHSRAATTTPAQQQIHVTDTNNNEKKRKAKKKYMKNLKQILNFHCAPFPCSILFYLPINSEWKLHGTEKCISQRGRLRQIGCVGEENRRKSKANAAVADRAWGEVSGERKQESSAMQNGQKVRILSLSHTHTQTHAHAYKTNSGYNLKAKTTKIIAKTKIKKKKEKLKRATTTCALFKCCRLLLYAFVFVVVLVVAFVLLSQFKCSL